MVAVNIDKPTSCEKCIFRCIESTKCPLIEIKAKKVIDEDDRGAYQILWSSEEDLEIKFDD